MDSILISPVGINKDCGRGGLLSARTDLCCCVGSRVRCGVGGKLGIFSLPVVVEDVINSLLLRFRGLSLVTGGAEGVAIDRVVEGGGGASTSSTISLLADLLSVVRLTVLFNTARLSLLPPADDDRDCVVEASGITNCKSSAMSSVSDPESSSVSEVTLGDPENGASRLNHKVSNQGYGFLFATKRR